MLNPVYDVRKIITYINKHTSNFKTLYYTFVSLYFISVIFLGMYIPLRNIHSMIFSDELDAYDKLILLRRVEKNYILAGFSLFLLVVLYGVRTLLSYTANLVDLVEKSSEPVVFQTISGKMGPIDESLELSTLKVKKSVSLEAILCTNELKDRLRLLVKTLNYQQYKTALSSVFETSRNTPNINF